MRAALVIAGASGVGKTTVAKSLAARGGFAVVRSATTRARRGDGNDAEYIYLTREEFFAAVEAGKMLEHTDFGANLYGTPRDEVDRIFAEGRTPLMILDLNGVRALKEATLDFTPVVVYLYEELDVIGERLTERERRTPSGKGEESLRARLELNRRDYRTVGESPRLFDAFVKNADVAVAADEVYAIFIAACRGEYPERESVDKIAAALAASAESYTAKKRV